MNTELHENWNEELWHLLFAVGHPDLITKQRRYLNEGLPPRCKLCLAPFGDLPPTGWSEDRPGPSHRNPRYCSLCDLFIREHPGGAQVRMTMIFADVRDSTRLAEALPLPEYVRLINNFYRTTVRVFIETDGFMMDIVGDQVFALYPSGFSGVADQDQDIDVARLGDVRAATAASKAVAAGRRLAEAGQGSLPHALPFGVAVHTGDVYIGTVRGTEDGVFDVRVWGSEVNKAARMCEEAGPGEALASEATCAAVGTDLGHLDQRHLDLRGISSPVNVFALR